MISQKKSTLQSILESSEGTHLTAYLVNRKDISDIKRQLSQVLEDAFHWLQPAMSKEQIKKFLEPLANLVVDSRILMRMKGNIGIFRNETSFRILNIPIDVQPSCQVATSFHVKPILRWLQGDQDFLFLGISSDSVHLYSGSQHTFRHLDSVYYLKPLTNKNRKAEEHTYRWVNDWISEVTKTFKPRMFIAGENGLVEEVCRTLKYKNLVRTPISNFFEKRRLSLVCQTIRRVLKDESRRNLERALLEFRFAESGNRVKKNIFQISKAVVQGKVRKLIVTDELSIFGKIDPNSGGLSIHPMDLDHEDDCILDDLAQMVLSKGGEVLIAKKNEIPNGRPILAIIDDPIEESARPDDFRGALLQK